MLGGGGGGGWGSTPKCSLLWQQQPSPDEFTLYGRRLLCSCEFAKREMGCGKGGGGGRGGEGKRALGRREEVVGGLEAGGEGGTGSKTRKLTSSNGSNSFS